MSGIGLRRAASRSAILGAAAVGALSASAQAATLYVANDGQSEVQAFSGVYGGSVVTATGANNFVSQTSALGVTVDGSGNVVVDSYASSGGNSAAAYSSSGAFLSGSAAFGVGNYATPVVYNNSVFVPSDGASYATISQVGYNASGNSASFGGITTLTSSTNGNLRTAALALLPAGAGSSNSYLVYGSFDSTSYFSSADYLNARNLSNGNVIALSTDSTLTADNQTVNQGQIQALTYDRNNGDLYADEGNSLYQIVPQFSGGTLSGFISSSLATTTGSGSGLNVPVGLAFGPDGNLYVAEVGSNEIDEINIDNFGTGTQGQLNEYINLGSGASPFGIAFSTVPEPASLSLLALGAVSLLRRRRR